MAEQGKETCVPELILDAANLALPMDLPEAGGIEQLKSFRNFTGWVVHTATWRRLVDKKKHEDIVMAH